MELQSIANILNTISDDTSLLLLKAIALCNSKSSRDTVIYRLHLTRNRYYSRMSKLVKANLVKRNNRTYFLTNLGKIIIDTQNIIAMAIQDYWKLKALDGIEMSDKFRLSETEYYELTETLINNTEIKNILVRHHQNNAIEQKKRDIKESRYATTMTTIQKSR
jgi:predicted transcriptional regulator